MAQLKKKRKTSEYLQRGIVNLDGDLVYYTFYEIDVRSDIQRSKDLNSNSLGGSLNVYIPGHGQSADGAKALMRAIAVFSASKVLWSIDVTPPVTGDLGKAKAIIHIIKEKCVIGKNNISNHKKLLEISGVSLFGWSHGGGEAMIIAEKAPGLVKNLVGICPTGLIQRSWLKLSIHFVLESMRIIYDAIFKSEGNLARVITLGLNIFRGIVRDLIITKSIQRIINDIRWASKKVCGEDYTYDGSVVLLFAENDGVNRWRDSFPSCQESKEVVDYVRQFRLSNFPLSKMLKVAVLPGNHMSPETNSELFIRTAFNLMTPYKKRIDN